MKLEFKTQDKSVDVEVGSSILEHAEKHGVDLDHACGGNCSCTTCHVFVDAGMENLSAKQEDEAALLETLGGVQANSRLGCQARIEKAGTVSVSVPN